MIQQLLKICNRYQWRIFIAIVLATLALSLGYSFYFQLKPIVDARAYDNLAWEMVQGKGYDRGSSIGRPGPAYVYFLAAIYYVFGHSYSAVWVVQSLFLALIVILVYFLTKLIFQESWHPFIGLAAAVLVGFSPDLITIASMLMTETLVVFLIILAVFFFFLYTDSKRIYLLPLVALVFASAALARGNTILLVLPVTAYFILKKEWLRGLLFLAVLLLALTPWTIRNYIVYGKIKPFNASTGLLYVGNHPGATGELIPNYPLPAGVDPEKMSQLEYDDALGRAGVDFIFKHPLEFIKLTFWRASIYFSFARPTGFWPHLQGFAKLATIVSSTIYAFLIFTLGTLGAWLAVKKNVNAKYLLAFIITLPLSVIALVVETRYRFPIYPFLAIFSGYGLWWLLTNFKVVLKPLFIVLGLLSANTIFDVLKNLQRILERISSL